MRKRIAWVASGCVIIFLLALAGDSLLFNGWSRLSAQAVAKAQPLLPKTDSMTSIIDENHSYDNSFTASAAGTPVVASATLRGADLRAAVQAATGSPIAPITVGMRVLGRDGRSLDRLAVRPGDILLWRGDTVQDESASTTTVSGPLAQVEVAQHLAILNVSLLLFGDDAPGTLSSQRRSDVLLVLLLPSTRLSLPHGQAFADLESEQAVQVTGTLNWRTHLLLRPTSFVVGAAPRAQQCTTLSVTGDQDCAGEPVNTP